jgi:hypothetical protein
MYLSVYQTIWSQVPGWQRQVTWKDLEGNGLYASLLLREMIWNEAVLALWGITSEWGNPQKKKASLRLVGTCDEIRSQFTPKTSLQIHVDANPLSCVLGIYSTFVRACARIRIDGSR